MHHLKHLKQLVPLDKLHHILALNENEKAPIVEKEHATLRPLMLKQLHEHRHFFLGKHEGKIHHTFCSLKSQTRF